VRRTSSIAAVLGASCLFVCFSAASDTPTKASSGTQSRYDADLYTLEISTQGTYRRGEPGAVTIHLEAKGHYKCNVEYPYKFKARERDGVSFERAVTRKDAMTINDNRCSMNVHLTPDDVGEKAVEGTFSFSVCTDERCVIEQHELGLTIAVGSK
jgi:hypothetical protein